MDGKIVRDMIRTRMLQRLTDIQKDFEQYSFAMGKPVQDLIKASGNISSTPNYKNQSSSAIL